MADANAKTTAVQTNQTGTTIFLPHLMIVSFTGFVDGIFGKP